MTKLTGSLSRRRRTTKRGRVSGHDRAHRGTVGGAGRRRRRYHAGLVRAVVDGVGDVAGRTLFIIDVRHGDVFQLGLTDHRPLFTGVELRMSAASTARTKHNVRTIYTFSGTSTYLGNWTQRKDRLAPSTTAVSNCCCLKGSVILV